MRGLVTDRSGVISMLFGLAAMVLFLACGGAVDFARVSNAKTKAQTAVDAAVIAGAREILLNDLQPGQQVNDKIVDFTQSRLTGATWTEISYQVTATRAEVNAVYRGELDSTLLKLIGMDKLPFEVKTRAILGDINLEMSLVVDTTGSIRNNGHINSITSALTDLVGDLEPMKPKISLVPFAETVNLGSNYQNSWIDFLGLSPTHGIMFDESVLPVVHHGMFARMNMSWNGCVEMRALPYDVTDDPPQIFRPATLWVPYFGPSIDPFGNYLRSGYQVHNGLNVVRNPNSYSPSNLSGVDDPGHSGENYSPLSNCPRSPLRPLSTDYSAIKSAINSLDFDGGTNIPSGLAWGWRTLSPGEPFTEGASYSDEKTRKVLILLSDGKNDMKLEYNGYGIYYDKRLGQSGTNYTEMTPLINGRMQQLCSNIKATGIELYVVSYALASDAETLAHKALMDQCASTPQHHFNAANPGALRNALKEIVKRETPIRIAS